MAPVPKLATIDAPNLERFPGGRTETQLSFVLTSNKIGRSRHSVDVNIWNPKDRKSGALYATCNGKEGDNTYYKIADAKNDKIYSITRELGDWKPEVFKAYAGEGDDKRLLWDLKYHLFQHHEDDFDLTIPAPNDDEEDQNLSLEDNIKAQDQGLLLLPGKTTSGHRRGSSLQTYNSLRSGKPEPPARRKLKETSPCLATFHESGRSAFKKRDVVHVAPGVDPSLIIGVAFVRWIRMEERRWPFGEGHPHGVKGGVSYPSTSSSKKPSTTTADGKNDQRLSTNTTASDATVVRRDFAVDPQRTILCPSIRALFRPSKAAPASSSRKPKKKKRQSSIKSTNGASRRGSQVEREASGLAHGEQKKDPPSPTVSNLDAFQLPSKKDKGEKKRGKMREFFRDLGSSSGGGHSSSYFPMAASAMTFSGGDTGGHHGGDFGGSSGGDCGGFSGGDFGGAGDCGGGF